MWRNTLSNVLSKKVSLQNVGVVFIQILGDDGVVLACFCRLEDKNFVRINPSFLYTICIDILVTTSSLG